MMNLLEGVLAVYSQGVSSYVTEVNPSPLKGVDKTLEPAVCG